MTTSMSAPHISASEPDQRRQREATAARAAGWRDADLRWEQLQEEANSAFASGDRVQAIRLWRQARRLAFWRFLRSDSRYATSLANAALAARLAGREKRARRLYRAALKLWRAVPAKAGEIEPARRARSSLFHLRMEARHRETYRATQRRRMAAFIAEAGAVLTALAEDQPPPHRLFARWRGEKPPVFDDSRKLLSAALLIATPEKER